MATALDVADWIVRCKARADLPRRAASNVRVPKDTLRTYYAELHLASDARE